MHEIAKKVQSLGFPNGNYAVIGGAVLSIHGIRENSDIDVLISTDLYDELRDSENQWKEQVIDKNKDFYVLKNGDFEAFTLKGFTSKNYNCDMCYEPDVPKIIRNAMMIDGIPFVQLEDLKFFKLAYGREKDLKDVILIEQYLYEQKRIQEELLRDDKINS